MSVRRFSIRGFSAAMVEEEEGVMVKWEDYAALAAEKADTLIVMAKLHMEYRRLQSENERLRKAGDGLLTCLDYPKAVWPDSVNPIIEAWHAAKGVQP